MNLSSFYAFDSVPLLLRTTPVTGLDLLPPPKLPCDDGAICALGGLSDPAMLFFFSPLPSPIFCDIRVRRPLCCFSDLPPVEPSDF
jgi:hypothetical protein